MPPEKAKSSSLKLGFLILVILILITVSSKLFLGPLGKGQFLISPKLIEEINLTSTFSFAFQSQPLQKIVAENLSGKKGEYAVVVEDLTDAEGYSLRDYDRFPAASLYKLYLLPAVLKELDDGNIKREDILSADKDHLEEVFGDTDFGYEDSTDKVEYTVDEALTRVGRISDNFASIMLAEKIGWDKVQKMADSLGATKTVIKSPIQISAHDIAQFFKKLNQKQVVNEQISNTVIDLLSLSKINDRIPARLPEEVKIVHKTGELAGVRHDGGIVYLEGRPYIIVLMSQNLQYEDDGVATLANISKEVYDYFANKK